MADLKFPPEVMWPLYTAVGMVAVNWALVESTMESCVAILCHTRPGKKILGAHQIPVLFGRKAEYIKDCLKGIPKLAPHRTEATALVSRAKILSRVRRILVHGALSDRDEAKKAILFRVFEVDQAKGMHLDKPEWLTEKKINQASIDALALGRDFHSFALTLMRAFPRRKKPVHKR